MLSKSHNLPLTICHHIVLALSNKGGKNLVNRKVCKLAKITEFIKLSFIYLLKLSKRVFILKVRLFPFILQYFRRKKKDK